jgi:hypothetical protein
MLEQTIRILAFGFGALTLMGGLLTLAVGGPAMFAGAWISAAGVVIMYVALIQRSGYRSEAAERRHDAPGPGGGESGYLDARFAPTSEAFIDPTSQLKMRVYEDPNTGERRYRAEG